METSINKNKDNNGHEVWQSLYVVTGHWHSDLQFYGDEMKFLNKLVDKFFIWLEEPDNERDSRLMKSRLLQLDNRRALLYQKVSEHMKHIARIVENPFAYSAQAYKDEHAVLEQDFSTFFKNFRQIKREVFRLTGQVMNSETDQNALTH